MLLPSRPDTVRKGLLRRTCSSTSLVSGRLQKNKCYAGNSILLQRTASYREPLTPHLAWQTFPGGERGIRTPDTLLTYTRFPGERLKPTQPSLHWITVYNYMEGGMFCQGRSLKKIYQSPRMEMAPAVRVMWDPPTSTTSPPSSSMVFTFPVYSISLLEKATVLPMVKLYFL